MCYDIFLLQVYNQVMKKAKNTLTQQSGIGVIVIIGIVTAVLVLGGVAYTVLTSNNSADSKSVTNATIPQGNPGTSETRIDDGTKQKATFEQLLKTGQSMQCDWKMPSVADDAIAGSGKLYTTASMGRSMYSGTVNGITMEGNAIYKNGGVTGWMQMNGQKFGFAMTPEEIATSNASLTEDQKKQAEQIRSEMIVSCKPWTPDMSYFEIPSDITFN